MNLNLDPNEYLNEGYCVFRNVLSSSEMKKNQNILNGMIRRLQPGEKPQFNQILAFVLLATH